MNAKRTSNSCATIAIIAPVVGLFSGLAYGASARYAEGYEILAYPFGIVVGLATSCVIALVFLVLSRARSEPSDVRRGIAFAANIPGIFCVLLVAGEFATAGKMRGAERRRADLRASFAKDPTTPIRERWDIDDVDRFVALKYSLEDPNVSCSEGILTELYEAYPRLRGSVLLNHGCSITFLEAHFDAAYEEALKGGDPAPLAGIMRNPNTPTELVEKVCRSTVWLNSASYEAAQAVKRRRPNRVAGCN